MRKNDIYKEPKEYFNADMLKAAKEFEAEEADERKDQQADADDVEK